MHAKYDVLHIQEAAAAFSVLQAALHRQLSNAMPGAEQATAGGLQIASSVTDLLKAAEEERAAFDSMLRDVANLLTPDADTWLEPVAPLPGSGAETDPKADRYPHATLRVPNYVKMLWEIGRLRRSLAVLVMTWAATLHDPVVYARPISHSHSVPNSLRSLQGSEGPGRQLSTDSLPDLTRDDAPLQVVNRHAAVEEAELAQQALQADDTQASSVASSENDSVDNRHNSNAEGPQEESADKDEPELESLTVEEQASPTAVSSTPPPALPGGIVAQTILNLERQGQRSTPTRMNAAAAARRFVASALEQRARTLQWLNSSRLSADEVWHITISVLCCEDVSRPVPCFAAQEMRRQMQLVKSESSTVNQSTSVCLCVCTVLLVQTQMHAHPYKYRQKNTHTRYAVTISGIALSNTNGSKRGS